MLDCLLRPLGELYQWLVTFPKLPGTPAKSEQTAKATGKGQTEKLRGTSNLENTEKKRLKVKITMHQMENKIH